MRIFQHSNRYIIHVYDYKGVTTQKQISRFIFEFCGYGYYKAYKKAREIMRKYNGEKMGLRMLGGFENWEITIFRFDGSKTLVFNI